jgi:hypothetical protein
MQPNKAANGEARAKRSGKANLADGTATSRSRLLEAVRNTLWWSEDLSGPQRDSASVFADRLLEAVDPQDEVEAILAVQMITAHVAAMEVMRRAMAEGLPAHGVEANVRQAQKLLGLFIRQLEVLNAHRGEPTRRVDVTYHLDRREDGSDGPRYDVVRSRARRGLR